MEKDMKLKDVLIKHEDGSYEPKSPISISRSDGNVVTIGPGVRLRSGVKFLGIDINDLLEKEISAANFGSDSASGAAVSQEEKKSDI
jgi:hypothetical protein